MPAADLTPQEILLVLRRRRGLNQAQMADLLGASRRQYRRWESGSEKIPFWATPDMDELRPHERLHLLRVRRSLTREQVADRVGVSCYWLTRMEHGTAPIDRLEKFWRRRARA